MASINDLSSTDTLAAGDLFPVWRVANSDTRKTSLYTLSNYVLDNVSSLSVIPTGATIGRTLPAWMSDVFNVKAGWGGDPAVGDGVTDDHDAINRAIVACNAAGGGVVFFPAGTYIVGNVSVGIEVLSNVFLVGVSRDVVTLKLKANIAGTAVVHFNGVSNVGLRGITVDGNRDNNPSGSHGIRTASCDDITIEDFRVKEAFAYGIGHQAGTLTRCFIRHGILSRIGGDGFDFKNRAFSTEPNDILTMDDIVVEEWALATSVDQQAAVDIRGPFNVSNIIVRNPGSDNCAGIRFRQDDLAINGNGPGGRYSNLVNFQINMGTATAGQGLYIAGQYVKATNGYVEGGQDGVICAEAAHFMGTGIVVKDCADDGFVFDSTSHDFVLTGCKVLDAGDTGFNVTSDRGKLIGCSADGCDEAFVAAATVANLEIDNMTMTNSVTRAGQIVAGATDVKIRGGVVENNLNILDAGTNTTIRDLSGYPTQSRGTASGTTDGSGDLTVTHGLITTPTRVLATTGGTTFMQAQVHTKGASTFKIRFLDAAGAALPATSATADWEASMTLFG